MRPVLLGFLAAAGGLAVSTGAVAQIKLGIAGPITGPNAAFGAQLVNGAEQAVADINAAGGIAGQPIQVVRVDDVSDPKQGVSAASKLASEGVTFVVGHFNSGVSIPASEAYAEAGVLQVTPASTNPRFTERKLWNVFRTCGRDDQQAEIAGGYILANYKGRKVGVVHDKTPYGKGLADETRKVINRGGLQEALYEGVNPGEKDFSALVSKLKASGIELMYWGGLHTELGLIIRQARDQGLGVVAMGADGITSDEFAAIGGPGVEGTKMTFPPDPRKRPEVQDIVKRFVDTRKFNPEAYTLYAYAAVQVIKQAAEKAGSLAPRTVAETLRSGATFRTVVGDIAYDGKGDRTRPDYVVYTWKKGPDGAITYVQD